MAKFSKVTGIKAFIKDTAVKTKLANLHSNCDYTHALWDKLIFDKVKNDLFGGCVRVLITASAPLSKDVCDFFKIAVGCPMLEGYG